LEDGKKYYSIGEVGKMTGLEPYVLRFWETEFTELSPKKNEVGRRIYQQRDIEVILKLKELLHERKYTIEGAKRVLRGQSLIPTQQTEISFTSHHNKEIISQIKKELQEILSLLD
jgi:DNA-binding transcriptional MerR regulator